MKVLIVDDEYEIRNGLSKILTENVWEDISISEVLKASNSDDALKYLAQNEINFVITDICMPGINGLKLTEMIQYRHPHIPIIILSGYDDKENLRIALRSGASDFLYKPVQLSELQRALSHIWKKNLREKKKSLYASLQQFHEITKGQCKMILAVDIDDTSSQRAKQFGDSNMLSWMMNKIALECAEEMDDVYFITDQIKADSVNLLLGISAASQDQVKQKSDQLSKAMSRFWEETMRLPISIGSSSVFTEQDPEEHVYHAKCALFSRTVHGSRQQLTISDLHSESEHLRKSTTILLDTLIEIGDMDGLEREIKSVVHQLYLTKDVMSLIKGLENLTISLYQKTREVFPSSTLAMSDLQLQLQKLLWYRSSEKMLIQLMKWLFVVFEEQQNESGSGSFIDKAEKYIINNYNKPLTLTDVANHCYLSPNHLSRLFREKKGMTFLEVLTAVRIEKAKQMLLEPGIKIYEVSEAVGYGSWKHFCRIFKEMTNTTPSEYRKKLV